MDDAEFTEIRRWLVDRHTLSVQVAADTIDAIDPTVEPIRRYQAIARAARHDPAGALLHIAAITCGLITGRYEDDPDGQAAYLRQLRSYAATGTGSGPEGAPL